MPIKDQSINQYDMVPV